MHVNKNDFILLSRKKFASSQNIEQKKFFFRLQVLYYEYTDFDAISKQNQFSKELTVELSIHYITPKESLTFLPD